MNQKGPQKQTNRAKSRVAPVVKKAWMTLLCGYALLALISLAFWCSLFIIRPVDSMARPLFKGVHYQRTISTSPPLATHVVTIDLDTDGIIPWVTLAEDPSKKSLNFLAKKTSEFLVENNLQLAINGGFFEYTYTHDPWRYHPHRGDPVTPHGLVVAASKIQNTYKRGLPVLCFLENGEALITRDLCPPLTAAGIGGAMILVKDGLIQFTPDDEHREPLIGVGLQEGGRIIKILVVDGRQNAYSEGMTQYEFAEFALREKIDIFMTLDGGGSSTLVMEEPWGPRLLNVPIDAGVPFRQRNVATHLGFKAEPLQMHP